jgi:hypothetical protein
VHGCNAPEAMAMLHRSDNRPETLHISTILKMWRRNHRNLTKNPFITSRHRH